MDSPFCTSLRGVHYTYDQPSAVLARFLVNTEFLDFRFQTRRRPLSTQESYEYFKLKKHSRTAVIRQVVSGFFIFNEVN